MNETKIFKGIGFVNIGDRNRINDYVNFTIKMANKTFKYAMSNSYDEKSLNVGRSVSGSIEFRGLTADILALLAGGNVSTDYADKHINEKITVPNSSPYTVTLSHAPISNDDDDTLVIYSKSATGVRVFWDKVDSGNEAQGKYSLDGDTLTFDVSDAGVQLYVEYFYKSDSPSTKISYGGSDDKLPAVFTLRGVMLMQTDSGEPKTMSIVAKNCRVTGEIDLGGAVQTVGSVKADFDIAIENADDMIINLED